MKQHITHLFLLLILCFCAQAQTPYVDANGRVRYYKSGVSQAPKVDCTQIPQWTQKFNQYRRNSTIGGDVTIPASGTTATLTDVNSSPGTIGAANLVPRLTIDSKGRITAQTSQTITAGAIGAAAPMSLSGARLFAQTLSSAPSSIVLTDAGKEGELVLDVADNTTPDNTGTVVVTASGLRYKRPIQGRISLGWFGAPNDLSSSAVPAFRKALKVVKNLIPSLGANGNPNRGTLEIPGGYFLIDSTLNFTNSQGVWVVGTGGPHLNSTLICATGSKPALDFSGSNYSGCENLTIRGGGSNSATSQIGVQFALTSNGGLNCGMRNCHIFLLDQTTAVLGSKGVVNSRSEEFYIDACTISANTPLIFSYINDISASGYTYTIASDSATVSTGIGSMGNVNIQSTSLHGIQRRGPAMILNGTNSVTFKGYIGRVSASTDTVETAVLVSSGINNFDMEKTTIESYSTLVKGISCSIQNSEFHGFISSSTIPSRPIFNFTGCLVTFCDAKISFVTAAARTLLYHAPGGTGQIFNSTFGTYGLSDDKSVISPALLKRSDNVVLQTKTPFEKRAGWVRQLKNQEVYLGTVSGTLSTSAIYQFNEARVSGTTSQNSGFYTIVVDGTLMVGAENDGNVASMAFSSRITVAMKPDGTPTVSSHTNFIDQSTTSTGFGNITNLVAGVTFSGGVGTVTLTPTVGGATGAVVNFAGTTRVYSKFLFNDIIPY